MTQVIEMGTCDLVKSLQEKSRGSFSKLYENYSPALFNVTRNMISNRCVAEDVLQEVFVKIWKNIDRYQPSKGTLFTWMLQITRNTCIDYLRSKQHYFTMRVSEAGLEQEDGNSLPGHIINNFQSRDLRQIAQKLEAKYKEVIDLVYFYGYSQDEVSRMLNIPVGTVKTRCRAAVQRLRCIYNI
jgi:RNA polymerase sigma factor (sigma-70 family)